MLAVGPRIAQAARFPVWAMWAEGSGLLVRLHGHDVDSEIVVYGLRRP